MHGRTAVFAAVGAVALVLGLATAAVGFYVSLQTHCGAGTSGAADATSSPPDCPRVGTWLAYGGGTAAVVGFFALLYAWVRFVSA